MQVRSNFVFLYIFPDCFRSYTFHQKTPTPEHPFDKSLKTAAHTQSAEVHFSRDVIYMFLILQMCKRCIKC